MPGCRRTRVITKPSPEAGEKYLTIGESFMDEIFSKLTQTECALYVYLACNKQGYKKKFYSSDFIERRGISRTQYFEAFRYLVEIGCLRWNEEDKCYDFYADLSNAPTKKERRKKNNEIHEGE